MGFAHAGGISHKSEPQAAFSNINVSVSGALQHESAEIAQVAAVAAHAAHPCTDEEDEEDSAGLQEPMSDNTVLDGRASNGIDTGGSASSYAASFSTPGLPLR